MTATQTPVGEVPADGVEAVEGVQPRPPVRKVRVTKARVIDDLEEAQYHGDPVPPKLGGSLSQSGAKVLIKQTPAHFKAQRDAGPQTRDIFDFGHAAHALVLGKGMTLVEVEAADWRTNAAKAVKEQAHAEGKTPLLSKDMRKAEAMAQTIREHPTAGPLFDPERGGKAEVSLFLPDAETGVFRRARLDWSRFTGSGRPLIVDYKTAESADPAKFPWSARDFGYYMQHAWYVDLVEGLGLADQPLFVFVVQEKKPPYAIGIVELGPESVALGREHNARALRLYAECQGTGIWPAYPIDPVRVELPHNFLREN